MSEKPTSADIVIEVIKGRGPEFVAEVSKIAKDAWFRAPEIRYEKLLDLLQRALFADVSDEERASLDRMRGNGKVDWDAVIVAFDGSADATATP